MSIIDFQQALAENHAIKRHLLLGNGFSISLFPKFRYDSLLEEVDFSDLPELKKAFKKLNTTNFEDVINALRVATSLLPIYCEDKKIFQTMSKHAERLKELLVKVIADRHPQRPSDIHGEQYKACRQFLSNFIGTKRIMSSSQKDVDLRGHIYTLNYDLLLYWTLLHEPNTSEDKITKQIEYDDGFRAPDDDKDAQYVIWDGEGSFQKQRIHYLHGALHFYDNGYELQKKCWERSGGVPLINQIRNAFKEDQFPLFVSEGKSREKFIQIRHSAYLHKCLRSFRTVCDSKKACLFIFGHSLAENDNHILKQIEKGKIESVYISLFNPHEDCRKIFKKANKIKTARNNRNPLKITFFDASSADVWNLINP